MDELLGITKPKTTFPIDNRTLEEIEKEYEDMMENLRIQVASAKPEPYNYHSPDWEI